MKTIFLFLFLFLSVLTYNNLSATNLERPLETVCMCDIESDSLALVALYNATDGANWTNKWMLDEPISDWYGITLDASTGCVSDISLASNQLNGVLPPELGQLSELTYLSLYLNQLNGSIPTELGQLTKLEYFRLDYNDLTGTIPIELGQLTNLRTIWLGSNELTGPLPSQFGQLTNIRTLWLEHNNLTGSIPSEFAQLIQMSHLSLGYNQLSGNIPPELGQLSNLSYLSCVDNRLSGSIPPELGQLSNLTYLGLRRNQLTGTIPVELAQLTNITSFALSENRLIGTIPPELGQLTNAVYFILNENQLTGSIPPELGQLTNLINLSLSENQLSGSIPAELGQLTNLTFFYLHKNQLEGCFPAELNVFCNLNFNNNVYSQGYNLTNNPNLPGGGNFSSFCSNNAGTCVLPLDLLSFDATVSSKNIALNWITSHEVDVKGFEIERSEDKVDFQKIAWEKATNQPSLTKTYTFFDKNVQANVSYYYRLKMINESGKIQYSDIVVAHINQSFPAPYAYPNPVSKQCELMINEAISGTTAITIFNPMGKVKQHFFSTEKRISLDMTTWTKGIYYVHVTYLDTTNVLQLVKL